MTRISSITLTFVCLIYFLPITSLHICQTQGEHHHGNCSDGMMDHHTKKFKSPSHQHCYSIQKPIKSTLLSSKYMANNTKVTVALLTSFITCHWPQPDPEFYVQPEPKYSSGPPPPSPITLRGPPLT